MLRNWQRGTKMAAGIVFIAGLLAGLYFFKNQNQAEIQILERKEFHLHYRPIGVVAIITPWNNPLAIPVSKIIARLLYGNCLIWKPALKATYISQKIYL